MKRLLAATVLACGLAAANADLINFTISATGVQEGGSDTSTAAGGGIATFDTSTDMLSVSVFFVGLSAPATASHIHVGAAGVPGPVILSLVPYTPAATFGTVVSGPLAFPVANIADLLAGNTYWNIHDSVYPGGEIRGQLVPVMVPEPTSLALLGLGAGALVVLRRRK
jgi:hypothetical protein